MSITYTYSLVLPFPCTKNTPISVCVYIRSAHRAFCVRKRAAYACRKNLWIPASISWWLLAHSCTWKHAASMGLRHARMNVSAGLSDACSTPSLLLRMFPCCKSRRNISSRSYHCALWVALRSRFHGWDQHMHVLHARMHANSDTETVTHMRGLHDGEIRFTSMNVIFKRW